MHVAVSLPHPSLHSAQGLAKEHANTSGEYFRLLARLLNHTNHASISIQGVDKLLDTELKWLLKVRVSGIIMIPSYFVFGVSYVQGHSVTRS